MTWMTDLVTSASGLHTPVSRGRGCQDEANLLKDNMAGVDESRDEVRPQKRPGVCRRVKANSQTRTSSWPYPQTTDSLPLLTYQYQLFDMVVQVDNSLLLWCCFEMKLLRRGHNNPEICCQQPKNKHRQKKLRCDFHSSNYKKTGRIARSSQLC